MYLTRHFVYLHVPRTGGNFVLRLLEEHAPAEWQLQRCADHATVHDIPRTHVELPKIALVRNPYAWYVSWYHFQLRTRDPFFLDISENGTLPFAATMRNALQIRPALALGEGPYTQTLREMLGHDLDGVRTGLVKHLRRDLLRLLDEVAPVPPAMAEAIRDLPPQNTSEHGHWSTYYDPELRELIAERDRDAMQFFGFEWEEPLAS